jgi:hypothetical protein
MWKFSPHLLLLWMRVWVSRRISSSKGQNTHPHVLLLSYIYIYTSTGCCISTALHEIWNLVVILYWHWRWWWWIEVNKSRLQTNERNIGLVYIYIKKKRLW